MPPNTHITTMNPHGSIIAGDFHLNTCLGLQIWSIPPYVILGPHLIFTYTVYGLTTASD